MIKRLFFKYCKTVICAIVLLTSAVAFPQCNLVITNPPCNAVSANITAASVTAGSPNIGTLTYWTNPNATVPVANPAAITTSGLYYIKNTVGTCTDVQPVVVTIGTTAPTSTPFLHTECSAAQTTPNSIFFDFNGVGQTSFIWSYTINGGPPITGTQTAPTSMTVTGLLPGQKVVYTISFVGVCTPPLTTTAYPETNMSFNLVNGSHKCIGEALPTTDLNGIAGSWNEPLITGINGNPSNYIFTPAQCGFPITFSFFNDAHTTPSFNPIGPFCQGSSGTLPPSTNGIAGTWAPASINTSVIGPASATFTPTAGQCADPVTINTTVTASVSPTFTGIPTSICQGSNYTLPAANGGVAGTWSPTVINASTPGPKPATFTPTAGQPCVATTPINISIQVNPNTAPVFNGLVTTYCKDDAPAANALPTTSSNAITGTWKQGTTSVTTVNTATAGSFQYTFTPDANAFPCAPSTNVTITITPKTTPTFATTYPSTLCQSATNPAPALPMPNNGITGSWNPATIDITTPGPKSSTFTPNPGQCANTATISTTVTALATIQFTGLLGSDFAICETAPMPILLNTSTLGTPITGTWNPAIINTSLVGVATPYTFTANAGQCVASSTYTINITINAETTPTYAVDDFCEGDVPPQGLTLPTNLGGVIGTWSPSGTINNSTWGDYNYTFNPGANQCSESITITVHIDQKAVPVFTAQQIAPFCAGTTPIPTLPTTSDNGFTGTWSPAVIDNMTTPETTYTFIPDAGQCAANGSMTIQVNAPANPGFTNITLCENVDPADIPDLEPTSPIGINGTWIPAAIDISIIGVTPYTFTPDAGECAIPQTIDVTINELALNDVTWVVSNYFSDTATVTFTATDAGNYLYQLDGGPIYESNVFFNVAPGTHTITVYDANGCSPPITKPGEVIVIGYPHFFTPNGDGIGDNWNIKDLILVNQPQATIHIFDRYGKLIKQIAPAGEGWNGTYNGNPLPSTDYWFVVKYEELGKPREFKSHFSLKR